MNPINPIIAFKGVKKHYGSESILDGVDFLIEQGSYIGLIGNNGCGKTTTVNILCNLIPKDSGELIIDNEEIVPGKVDFKRKLGIVLSEPYYIPDFSVKGYLTFVCKFQGITKPKNEQRIEDLTALFDLGQCLATPIKRLSSGEKMKVSLAAALIHNPKILVLDEPFVNLDIQTTQLLMQILLNFKGKKTLFITSHNLDLIVELCDEFLILDQGKINLRIRKEDFGSIEALKQTVKSKLTQNDRETKLTWLT